MRSAPSPSGEHLQKGREAEDGALKYLQQHGLRCLARNFRSRYGEIDLVMEEGGTLVFVEVRYRAPSHFGTALESVDARKRARLKATAQWYLSSRRVDAPARFDVIGVTPGIGDVLSFVWIKDAIRDS